MSKRMINAIAVVITAAWAISFLVDTINPKYDPPPGVHALMLIVAGAAFTGSIFKANGKNGGNGA